MNKRERNVEMEIIESREYKRAKKDKEEAKEGEGEEGEGEEEEGEEEEEECRLCACGYDPRKKKERCRNMYCCHPDPTLCDILWACGLASFAPMRLEGEFSLKYADFFTNPNLMACKCEGCKGEILNADSPENIHLLLFQCRMCVYATRPWKFPYRNAEAELVDLEAKKSMMAELLTKMQEEFFQSAMTGD